MYRVLNEFLSLRRPPTPPWGAPPGADGSRWTKSAVESRPRSGPAHLLDSRRLMNRRRDIGYLCAGCLVIGCSLSGGIRAQSPVPTQDLSVQVVVGFSDVFRLGHWAPLTVVVENRGSELNGFVEVLAGGGDALGDDTYITTYRRQLNVSRGSRKRVQFTVWLESFSEPLVVRVVERRKERWRREVDLRSRFTERSIVLVLGRDADLDYLNASPDKGWRVLYPHPSTLPAHWQGYAGVEAVVLQGISLETLSHNQHEALEKWLSRGGVLVVSGGPDYALLRTPRLAQLLPASPNGFIRFNTGEAVSRGFGVALQVSRPFDINQVRVVESPGVQIRVAAARADAAASAPLVVERIWGWGKVVYLTFDIARYPFDRWTGMPRVWRSIFAPISPRPAPITDLEVGPIDPVTTALRDPRLGFPGHATLLAFLGAYLTVLFALYALARDARWDTTLRAGLVWAAPLLFAPSAYFVFGPLLFPARATALVMSVIEPIPHSPFAALDTDVAAYVIRRSSRPWHYKGAAATFVPGPRTHGVDQAADWVFGQDVEGSAWVRTPQPYWLYRVRGHDVIRFEVEGQVTARHEGFELALRNSSGMVLSDTWVVLGRRAFFLGDLDSGLGTEKRLSLTPGDSVALRTPRSWWRLFGELPEIPVGARVKEALLKQAANRRLPLPANQALLIAFPDNPVRTQSSGGSWETVYGTVLVQRLPVIDRVRAPLELHGIPEEMEDEPL